MACLAILFILLICFALILNFNVYINLQNTSIFKVKVRLALLTYTYSKTTADGKSPKKKKAKRPSGASKRILISAAVNIINQSYITVNRLYVPYEDVLTYSCAYHAGLFTALSFLGQAAKGLFISDNAFALCSDCNKLSFDLTLKIKLYRLLIAAGTALRKILVNKMQRRLKIVGK